jgi:molybdenum cofactor guanylyltransferase
LPSSDPSTECCAVILSGGLNSRMGGHNKALLELGGSMILDRVLKALEGLFDEILLVSRDPRPYEHWPFKVVADLFEARSSLTGIHAGLTHCTKPYAFVVPCDAPFLQKALIEMLLSEIRPDLDVIVPRHKGLYQPLCAIYAKRCLDPIEAQLGSGDLKIINFFDQMRLKVIPSEKLQLADPALRSFINVNTPEALESCRNAIGSASTQ